VSSRVSDPDHTDRPRAGRSLWLRFAIVSSAVIVIAASLLITSFFVSDGSPILASAGGTDSTSGKPLTVALARTPGGSLEWRTFAVAIHRMGRAVGRPMRLRYVESSAEMTDLLLKGEVDAAFTCTYCYLQVAGRPGVALVAAPEIAGHVKEAAVLVVREDSRYGSLEDLRGRNVGVTGATSLAGNAYLLWLAELEGLGSADPLVLVQADSQEESIRALLAEEVEAVVVNRSQLASWRGAGIRVIATSPEFGMPPFVTGPTVGAGTRDLMQRALLTMRPSSEVTPTSIEGFTVPRDADYEFARTLATYIRTGGTE